MHHDDCREAVLKDEMTRRVRSHLERCPSCARLADAVAEIKADLRSPPPASSDLVERVLERYAREETATNPQRAYPWEATMLRAPTRRWRGWRHPARRLVAGVAVAIVAVGVSWLGLGPATGGAIAMGPFTAACADTAGQLVVAGTWAGEERARFVEVLERFEDMTGAEVRFEYKTRDIAAKLPPDIARPLTDRVASGCPPDVALLPQPALLEDFARHNQLKPLDASTATLVESNYPRQWRRLATVDGKSYGVWLKAANKSTIWYSRGLFDQAGVRPPRTIDELQEVADKLRAAGITPFAVAGDDGWTLTDWFENVYLRTAGPGLYRRLASGDLSWTHSSVRNALLQMSKILDRAGWRDEDVSTAMTTDFEDSVAQVARGEAAMVFEGDFVGSFIDEQSRRDIGAFAFPTGGAPDGAAVVGGDVAVQFTDKPAARALMRFFATPEAVEPWARAGGLISPNRKLDLRTYRDPIARGLAKELIDAEAVLFDLSDVQPPAFGSMSQQGMWPLFQRYLKDGPSSVEDVTRDLQAGAQSARACEKANSGGKVAAQC